MNLRSLSRLPDDLGTLPPPLPRAPEIRKPAETREERPDGVVITDAQGRMRFEPSAGPDKPAPVPPAAPPADTVADPCCVPEGAMWRGATMWMRDNFYRWHDGRAEYWSGSKWMPCQDSAPRETFDDRALFKPLQHAAEPGAHGFLLEPLRVGDKVRLLDDYFDAPAGYVAEVIQIDRDGTFAIHGPAAFARLWLALEPNCGDCKWERMPADPKPAPLRVGDRVRVIADYYKGTEAGRVCAVTEIRGGMFWTDADPSGMALTSVNREGKFWERA